MVKEWKKVENYIFREDEDKFSLMSYITWELKDKQVYLPALHHIYKDKFSKEDIENISKQMFPNNNDINFYKSIMLLSSFIGECLDIYDENNESVSFYLNEDEGNDLIPKKLLYIANKYNL